MTTDKRRWLAWFVALVLTFPVAGTACNNEIGTETGEEGGGESEGEGGEGEGGEGEGGEGEDGAEVDVETD